MSGRSDNEIFRMQREIIGKRYEGATLSGFSFEGSNHGNNSVINWLKKGKNFLVILGPPGVGKTYFCSALIHWIHLKTPSWRYWHEREFFTRIRGVIGSNQGDFSKEVENIMDDHFVMYDDMGCCGINEWRREIILSLIDIRYESTKPTVVTTNLTKKSIQEMMGSRTSSRIFDSSNLILDMSQLPDRRQEKKQ